MLICVDGTGCSGLPGTRAGDYAIDMAGSFVGRVYSGTRLRNRWYSQGPDLTGIAYMVPTATVVQKIGEFWRGGDHQIFLAGYSRGGAVVIDVAWKLTYIAVPGGKKAEVDAMFLFDAVNQTIQLGPTTELIPANVKACYHAMRSPSAHSRVLFGNCGRAAQNPKNFKTDFFITTHGGMGGVLWGEKGIVTIDPSVGVPDYGRGPMPTYSANSRRSNSVILPPHPPYINEDGPFPFGGETNITVAQEKAGSAQVWTWMRNSLGNHGVL